MNNKIPACIGFAFSLTAAGMLGAVVAAIFAPTTTIAVSSIGAEVGHVDDHYKNHVLHAEHTHEEHEGSGDPSVGLTGQAAGFAQATMAASVTVALRS